MKRSKLNKKANKTKSVNDLIKYKEQRNLIVKLNKNCKKEFLDNLEIKNIPHFSNKHSKCNSDILLIEEDELLLKIRKFLMYSIRIFSQSPRLS